MAAAVPGLRPPIGSLGPTVIPLFVFSSQPSVAGALSRGGSAPVGTQRGARGLPVGRVVRASEVCSASYNLGAAASSAAAWAATSARCVAAPG